ncbi:CGNR zinc finger domain-containing protein [Yinghuangia soli]|uniref:CGNR zinc finger domain-containing protein n=1 Tax=Yinghuangia soli TaxID=2908204 RepID=A0AA41PWQ9_9ACTN|nr:CGNR zinc finger domain-containing protein [Yinghuangia soli]MCF2527239.1 CGNR zinc finger domain-containing protein [Yinghuangia soli]
MDVNGYRSDGVGASVAMVNFWTVDHAGADAPAPTVEQVRELLAPFSFLVQDARAAHVPLLAAWAAELRGVFEAADLEEAVDRGNALLAQITVNPRLVDHGYGLHVHYAPSGVPFVDRARINSAMGIANLLAEYGIDRSGVCAADACERVYADTSRNGRRRYCSEACANRANVAAHRARKRAATGSQGD